MSFIQSNQVSLQRSLPGIDPHQDLQQMSVVDIDAVRLSVHGFGVGNTPTDLKTLAGIWLTYRQSGRNFQAPGATQPNSTERSFLGIIDAVQSGDVATANQLAMEIIDFDGLISFLDTIKTIKWHQVGRAGKIHAISFTRPLALADFIADFRRAAILYPQTFRSSLSTHALRKKCRDIIGNILRIQSQCSQKILYFQSQVDACLSSDEQDMINALRDLQAGQVMTTESLAKNWIDLPARPAMARHFCQLALTLKQAGLELNCHHSQ